MENEKDTGRGKVKLKEMENQKETANEKSWYVYDSRFRCKGDPRDCGWKFEKRMKDIHSNPAPPPTTVFDFAWRRTPRPPRPQKPYREDRTFTTRVHYSGRMVETFSKQYLGGKCEHMSKCNPDNWSKLEVDDFLTKLGVDIRGLDYYYLKHGKDLKEGLMKLFDNNSSLEMAKIGVYKGWVDLFAVEAAEVLRCQTPPTRQDGTFSVRLHYSGVLVGSSEKRYTGGEVQYVDHCDPDRWSKLEVDDVLEKLGVDVSKLEYYYLKPRSSLDDGLVRLFDNISSMEMAELGVKEGVVDLYAIDTNDLIVSQLTQEYVSSGGVGGSDGVGVVHSDGLRDEEFRDGDGAMADVGGGSEDEGDVDSEGHVSEDEGDVDSDGDTAVDLSGKGKGKLIAGVGVRTVVHGNESTEDALFIDSEYDLSDHEEDAIMATQVEGWKKLVDDMVNDHVGDTDESDHLPSDSPWSGSEDEQELDDRNGMQSSRRYNKASDYNDPRWEVGMRFNCKEDFRDLIRHQGVLQGKKLRLLKNDKVRCVANCVGVSKRKNSPGCPWFVQIRFRPGLGFWQISRLRDQHKCGGAMFTHGCANARYLSKKYKEDACVFPTMTVGQFIEKVHSDMRITISQTKAKRAMQHARKLIEVDLVRQYRRLHDYRAEILWSNPGSMVVLSTHRLSDGTDKFKAIYIAYETCKTSFKRHCRRLVGLDGYHLRGQCSGILLTAIGLDPNDQIFPIAHAVVRIENT